MSFTVLLFLIERYIFVLAVLYGSERARADVALWAINGSFSLPPKNINIKCPQVTIYTDAFLKGWGMAASDGSFHSGNWLELECKSHLNYL